MSDDYTKDDDDQQKPSKQNLLRGLEEIHQSLTGENEEILLQSEIPLLTDSIEQPIISVSDESEILDDTAELTSQSAYFQKQQSFEYIEDIDVESASDRDERQLREAYRANFGDAEYYLAQDEMGLTSEHAIEDGAQGTEIVDGQGEEVEVDVELDDELELDVEDEVEVEEESIVNTSQAAPGDPSEDDKTDDSNPPANIKKTRGESDLPQGEGENPFLPKHIRDRLHQGKNDFLVGIAQVSESLDRFGKKGTRAPDLPSGVAASRAGTSKHQAMIDELIALYLPRIEADLRRKLAAVILREGEEAEKNEEGEEAEKNEESEKSSSSP